MTEKEKTLAGELYDCGDPELLALWHKAKDLARDYNRTDSADAETKDRILSEMLGSRGKNLWITAPFLCGLRRQHPLRQQLRSQHELHVSGRQPHHHRG